MRLVLLLLLLLPLCSVRFRSCILTDRLQLELMFDQSPFLLDGFIIVSLICVTRSVSQQDDGRHAWRIGNGVEDSGVGRAGAQADRVGLPACACACSLPPVSLFLCFSLSLDPLSLCLPNLRLQFLTPSPLVMARWAPAPLCRLLHPPPSPPSRSRAHHSRQRAAGAVHGPWSGLRYVRRQGVCAGWTDGPVLPRSIEAEESPPPPKSFFPLHFYALSPISSHLPPCPTLLLSPCL